MTNSIAELADAKLILAVGTNTTETHPVLALRVKEAVRRGAKLIVADPRRIDLTDHATRWLRLRIGTDTALFNAMARVIIEEGLESRDFDERHLRRPERAVAFQPDPALRQLRPAQFRREPAAGSEQRPGRL
jgi:predicted molibdopterin-dependent oxidoreductase YjgC